MQFVRATHFTAVLGFALASGLNAQHGTGHAGVAGPGFAPGFQRGVNAPQSGPNLGGRPYPIRRDLPAPVGLNPPASAYTGISPGALRPDTSSHRGSRFFPGFVAPPVFLPSYFDTGLSSFPSFNESAP